MDTNTLLSLALWGREWYERPKHAYEVWVPGGVPKTIHAIDVETAVETWLALMNYKEKLAQINAGQMLTLRLLHDSRVVTATITLGFSFHIRTFMCQ
jgi:hypothetical protein